MMVKEIVKQGDTVCDMTLGNGYDMRYLLERVGPGGTLYGFDIQEEAILTCHQIGEEFPNTNIHLIHGSHERIQDINTSFSCILYNLGYLPGGNKEKITHPKTTFESLRKAIPKLRKGGAMLVTVYGGHDENCERKILIHALKKLKGIDLYHFKKEGNHPMAPSTLLIQRKDHI